MTAKRVVLTTPLPEAVEAELVRRFSVCHASARPVGDELVGAAEGAFALVVAPGDRFDSVAISKVPRGIVGLASYSVGVDHIDLEAARGRGLIVTHTPGVLTEATADLTLHLILSAARGTSRAESALRNGAWAGWRPADVFGVDLRGRTLGILGYGRIGRAVASRAAAFGMTVVFYDRKREGAQGDTVRPVSNLGEFFAVSDVLSIHVPSTPETRGMIDEGAIEAMKPGVILINTARGDIVDDDAVIRAAESGQIRALGLDVFDGEPALNPRYLSLPNATLLPHIGSSTVETRAAMGAKVMASLEAMAVGEDPPDRVV